MMHYEFIIINNLLINKLNSYTSSSNNLKRVLHNEMFIQVFDCFGADKIYIERLESLNSKSLMFQYKFSSAILCRKWQMFKNVDNWAT